MNNSVHITSEGLPEYSDIKH